MNIQIAPRVLTDPRWHPLLDAVVSILQQSGIRHGFEVSQIAALIKSPWLAHAIGTRATTAEFIRSSAKAVSRDGQSDAVTILLDDLASLSGVNLQGNVVSIHPFGALTILMQPLHLIVEDESSDGAFLLWIARLLGRDAVRRSYRAGRLSFRHAGGKGQIVKSARALTFGVWPREGEQHNARGKTDEPILSLQLRAIALLDSDADFLGHEPNKQIAQDVVPYVASVHILRCRAIENYVSLLYAQRHLGLIPSLRAYFRMSEPQRSHFPIKKGFRHADRQQAQDHATFLADQSRAPQVRELFRSVDARDWDQFADGFGSAFADVFSKPECRCEPNHQNQLTREQKTELNAFLTQVIKYL